MKKYIRTFEEISLADLPLVGGKNASLGELTKALTAQGVSVPRGFAITVDAYEEILNSGSVRKDLDELLSPVFDGDIKDLNLRAQQARAIIKKSGIPQPVRDEIISAYRELSSSYGSRNLDVAVRSSATAEDLPDASFAGQQESFLNVQGEESVLESCLNCFASLFTERAISYRKDKGFDQLIVRLSVGVQKMVRSDLASAGVIFTIDTESGFKNTVLITSAYGLGENVVSGRVDPDEFLVFKPTLASGYKPILRRKVGAKQQRLVYASHGTRTTNNLRVPAEEQEQLSLSDDEVVKLAAWALKIENHYRLLHGKDLAMDIEWAKDGNDGQLYIVQARPETVYSSRDTQSISSFTLDERSEVLLEGRAIGDRIGAGRVRLIRSKDELSDFEEGEVLVADMTDPDWEPVMKRASAIVTNRGGRTCHAAIVSRELGVPCVVGTQNATAMLASGREITVCCAEGAQGKVYNGHLAFSRKQINVGEIPRTKTQIMINLGDPEQAFALAQLPVDGVGLAREEFIIANEVKVHPLALTQFDELKDENAKRTIAALTRNYSDKTRYFVDKLAEGVSTIAAAFYPRPVIVRLSDFKTNEYANLLGGQQFEPKEDNPMIGFRGASRYYSDNYKDGFALECKALKIVRNDMGLANLKIMVPFCRTIEEASRVLAEMSKNGLTRGENGLEVYVMCEIPANVILADEFAELFDGFSIGSNDLTQLVLGVDRDSELVAPIFDERNLAVERMISLAILAAKKAGRKIGICGQAPSDYPEFAKFLVETGIDSLSLNPDAVLKTIALVAEVEGLIDADTLKSPGAAVLSFETTGSA
jgi:pyruvate,water dikinase